MHLHGKLKNSTILEKNKKKREEDGREEQRGLLLYSSIKSIVFSWQVSSLPICKSTNHMHLAKHWIAIKILETPLQSI